MREVYSNHDTPLSLGDSHITDNKPEDRHEKTPDIRWAVVRAARDDDEPWTDDKEPEIIAFYTSEEAAMRAAKELDERDGFEREGSGEFGVMYRRYTAEPLTLHGVVVTKELVTTTKTSFLTKQGMPLTTTVTNSQDIPKAL